MFCRLPYIRHIHSGEYKQGASRTRLFAGASNFPLATSATPIQSEQSAQSQRNSIQDINIRSSHSPPFGLRLTIRRHESNLTWWRRRIFVYVAAVAGRSSSGDITACADLFRARRRIAHGEQRARRRTTNREDEWLLKLQHLKLILRNPLSCECCLSCRCVNLL